MTRKGKDMKEENSLLANTEQKGIEKGIKEVAINLLDILDDETISMKTGLTVNGDCEFFSVNCFL